MPQSLSLVIVHVIFSTKERRPFLDPDTRPKLHAYLATVARNAGCEAYRVGGVADHVHFAIRLSRTITIADFGGDVENVVVEMGEDTIARPRVIFVATRLRMFFRRPAGRGGAEGIH